MDELADRLSRIDGALLRLAAAVEVLAARPPPGSTLSRTDRDLLDALLPAISARIGNFCWTVADLREHLEVDRALAAVVAPFTGKQLGKLLARGEGYTADGNVLLRVGVSRAGAIWLVSPLRL